MTTKVCGYQSTYETQKIPSAVLSPAFNIKMPLIQVSSFARMQERCRRGGLTLISISLVNPAFPLHSTVIARGLTDAVLRGGMSTLLAQLRQHPKYPKWIFASLCSTAYSEWQGSTRTTPTLTRAGTINPNDFQLWKRNFLKNKTEFFTYPRLYLESSLDSKTQPPAQQDPKYI